MGKLRTEPSDHSSRTEKYNRTSLAILPAPNPPEPLAKSGITSSDGGGLEGFGLPAKQHKLSAVDLCQSMLVGAHLGSWPQKNGQSNVQRIDPPIE